MKEIRAAANEAGLAWHTVRRAQEKLGVVARKDGLNGPWKWHLPEGAQPDRRVPDY
jgi:putative DNA primase/helicase